MAFDVFASVVAAPAWRGVEERGRFRVTLAYWSLLTAVAAVGHPTITTSGREVIVAMNPMQTAPPGACWRQWGAPRKLDPHADGAIARFPRIAVGAATVYVIGVEFQLADDQPM